MFEANTFFLNRNSQTSSSADIQDIRSKIRESGNARIVNGLSSTTRTMEIVYAEVEKVIKSVSCFILFTFFICFSLFTKTLKNE